ncbi:hypothetical protein MTO96_021263 [Rhipicephalus appendiculatus]
MYTYPSQLSAYRGAFISLALRFSVGRESVQEAGGVGIGRPPRPLPHLDRWRAASSKKEAAMAAAWEPRAWSGDGAISAAVAA